MLAAFFADTKSTFKSRMNRDETGATAVEYGIMVALIAVVIIAAVTLLGGGLKSTFESAQCAIGGKTYTAAVKEVKDSSGAITTAAAPSSCA